MDKKKVRKSVLIDEDLDDFVKQVCSHTKVTYSHLINYLIYDYLVKLDNQIKARNKKEDN